MNAAQKWVMRSAITKFVNGPQLLNLIRSSWDVVSTDDLKQIFKDLNIKLPRLRDDKTTVVSTPLTKSVEQFKNFLKGVYTRYEQLPGEDKRLYSWIPVVTYGAARAAALDIRLVYPNAKDDPGSKVNNAVQKAFDVWERSKESKGAQLIFSDTYNIVNMEKLASFAAGGNVTLEIEEETPSEDDSESETASDGEMFLYRDIRNKLVARGISADEIAIVKEVKEQNRETLFEQVNNGRIRILIGGTSNMGVGVNVQKRLCAIHHLDTPWVPADLEQRQGRMIRQGNMNDHVEEFAYGMENTLDAAIYTKILRKAKFIWQVLAGKVSAVEFDDPAAPLVLTAKEQQAFLSGDPRIFEKIELEHQGRQLRMEHDAHVDSIARQRVKKDGYQRDVKTFEESIIPKAQKFADSIAASIDGVIWQADIDGQSISDPKAIAEKIDAMVKPNAQRILDDAKGGKIQQWKEPALDKPPKENHVFSVAINGVIVDLYASGYAVAVSGEKGGLAKEWRRGYQTIGTLADGTVVYRGTSHTGKGILDALAELPAKAQQDVTAAKARLKFFVNSIKELDELINTTWDKKQQLDEIDEKLRRLGDSLTGGNSAFVAKDPFMMSVEMEAKAAGVSNHAIIATISRDFNVPIYTGRIGGKPAGIYKHIQEIIRIKGKFVGDLAVTTHEVAHHIDKMHGISKMEWTEATKAELEQLDYEPMGRIEEGFAEFIRHLLTEDDAHIVAPHFYHFFVDEFLLKKISNSKKS